MYTLEPNFYFFNENYIEGQDMELYKTFLTPFDSTNLNPFMHNDSVKNKEIYISSDYEESPKDLESSSDR